MNGALKAAWALTAFVIVAGVVGWLVTGRVVFAVFIVLGLLTAVGAVLIGRSAPKEGPTP
jgi:dolichol kinase